MSERDFLDDFIAKRAQTDPVFAEQWAKAEASLALAKMRRDAGMTQSEVATAMGVPQPRVAEIERDPSRVSLDRIAKYVRAVGGRIEFVPLTR